MTPRQRNLLQPGALLQQSKAVYELIGVERYIRSTPYGYLLRNILTKQEYRLNRYDMLELTEITMDSPSYKSWKVLYAN